MKIAVIGGGSTYTPELVHGFLSMVPHLPLRELWLMDIDPIRLDIVGGFARRMVAAKHQSFKVVLSTNQRDAIEDSNYIITQFRVGQMNARVQDEYLGKRYGLIGQETTGIGWMAMALRTIPVILNIAQDIHATAPGAVLLNFTNPSGLVTEALNRYAPDILAVGVCNVGITTKMKLLQHIATSMGKEIDPEHATLQSLGLNHLTWHRGFTIYDEDVWSHLFPRYIKLETLGMVPNDYLQYYYYTDKKIALQKEWPPSRGEEVIGIEKKLLHQYNDQGLIDIPSDLMLRGGAYYSTLATHLIHSHHNDIACEEVVNVKNNGGVKEWPSDWVLEMPCKIDRHGFFPIPTKPLPAVCFGLIAQVKSYEQLTVEAAVRGDRDLAFQALLAHPLGPDADKAAGLLEDMLITNKLYLPQFFSEE